MQVWYAHYYPTNNTALTQKQKFINLFFDIVITKKHFGKNVNPLTNDLEIAIKNAFLKDMNHEISLIYKNEFSLNSNQIWFEKAYERIRDYISKEESQNEEKKYKVILNVLYNFGEDNFANYKTKTLL
jgi:hypothetical protein